MDDELNASCPECGAQVVPVPPRNWITPGETPGWTHAWDGTALCPVFGKDGYRPAEPVLHLNGPDMVLIIRGREATR
ncbi:hypothetical protein [Pseudonocardia oroxyli]|uniref:Uncharacterized protein n=1 Tax=Pseudonocardia oroxyli TaxID=366584 RepID=A0A1G8ENT6_PSEOR|nr:hypothetical protein [Pseudonocardia oroxyli]SDH71576.1 hypothetical protein SAMN05216377_1408 [Pseudonocardia oroxyli]